jgi:hypothetical protein
MQTAYWDRKAVVFAAVERGGRIRADVIPNSRQRTDLVAALSELFLRGSQQRRGFYRGWSIADLTGERMFV